ncbi:MAG: hypothetical protein ABI480_03995 [Chitinophagaceae bacterium]
MKRGNQFLRTSSIYRTVSLLTGIGICLSSHAQTKVVEVASYLPGTTEVVPGKEYRRSGYHNFFWGKHYRKEWATPVRVNNFYLDTAMGGLTPVEKGGSRQSSGLRLKDKNGKEYVLRSIDKDFSRALPDDIRGTFISRLAKDQGSSGHPFSGITIAPMSEAAGIYHTNPIIVFVPSQKALGEYDAEFGNQLYLFEERPDDNQETAANFGNSKKVIGSDKLFEHIYDDNDYHVDAVAFVRARLFDMFIGDWGRHPDNWRWAAFEDGKETIYKPIPRDRDQAYTLSDGLYPSIAGSFTKQIQGFNSTLKHVGDWNYPGHPLDRLFLDGLERNVWVKQAQELQAVLTDSLIARSIRQMPPEIFPISGNKIISKLKSRRDHLVDYANAYYEYLAKFVDLTGTDSKELFTVDRVSKKETQISIYKISKDGEVKKEPYLSRRFNTKDTKEVRIYGLGKEDVIHVGGEEKKGVKIRIIDPKDKDSVVFDRKGQHNEVSVYRGKKFEYDTLHEKKFNFSIRPFFSASQYKVYDRDPLKLFPRTGLKVAASITYNTQPWKKEEYENTHHISANYGFLRGAFNVGYVGRFGRLIGKWDLVLKARLDAPSVENYFGTGNETVLTNKTTNYYRTFSTRMYGGVGIERDLGKYQHVEASLFYHTIKFTETNDHFIAEGPSVIDPAVFVTSQFAGVEAGYTILKVNNEVYPTRGFSWTTGAGYTMNAKETGESFVSVNSNAAVYLPLGNQFSIAVRAGGATLSGDADFFNLNKIGGGGNGEIRAYERERFYGKSTAYFNGDLRWLFNTHNFLFNGKAGLMGFYDIGRVWQPSETSDLWHDGYGFGVIIVPFNKYALSGIYGISPEGNNIHFKVGLLF